MFKNILTSIIASAIVAILVVVLVGGNNHQLGASTTTHLPSLGLATLSVGSGCGDDYTACTGLTVDGNGTVVTNAAASSTVQIGGSAKAGCLILGDSANSTSTVYVTVSGSTVTASTTKPSACRAAI